MNVTNEAPVDQENHFERKLASNGGVHDQTVDTVTDALHQPNRHNDDSGNDLAMVPKVPSSAGALVLTMLTVAVIIPQLYLHLLGTCTMRKSRSRTLHSL
jgi:hypothetical protein